jgi:hypothetical protein
MCVVFNISEKFIAPFSREKAVGNKFIRNAGNHIQNYMASQTGRL